MPHMEMWMMSGGRGGVILVLGSGRGKGSRGVRAHHTSKITSWDFAYWDALFFVKYLLTAANTDTTYKLTNTLPSRPGSSETCCSPQLHL